MLRQSWIFLMPPFTANHQPKEQQRVSRDDLANENPLSLESQAMRVPFMDVRDWTLLSWCPWESTPGEVPLCRLMTMEL